MLFNSIEFLIFFPLVCLLYYLIPHRFRCAFLLLCSYFFYMCWNPKYALLLLTSTVITYAFGLLIESADRMEEEDGKVRRKKLYVALSFVGNLAILFFFKYYTFAADTIVRLLRTVGIQARIPVFDLVLPVGISFYTFKVLSYTMDVYRKEICAERNFLKYALYVSFFPQIAAGPIERSKNLLTQMNEKHKFEFEKVRSGLLLMLYGYFQKVVLSEYLAIVVNNVYDSYKDRTGFQLLVATILFAFQIYCDFDSYSNIAVGAAQVMGFRTMENFNTPYLAESVADFWRRWHISLSGWFRDYLYIPLGGNRKGEFRRQLNLMIVFFVSGLWHGASWHFVVWGCINGAWQIIGRWLKPARKKIKERFHVDETVFSHKLLRILITFGLIDFSWIFFRADFRQGLAVIKKIIRIGGGWLTWGDNMKDMGLTYQTVILLGIGLLILLLADLCKYKKIDLIEVICRQGLWLRWLVYLFGIFGILIFGVYGPGYDAQAFIYFQF